MLEWARDLWAFPRSLTGEGVRQTLDYLQELNPELLQISERSGTKVFDWTIPEEWTIRDAFIEHVASGERFAEFSESNLHLVGYSEPIDTVMPLEQLSPHVFTLPDQPDWVPYVTSYYRRTWGFCLSENQKESLPAGEYRVFIDSSFHQGSLDLAHAVFPGRSSSEVLFSSYICHPSMANNELSGPVLISALMRYLKEEFPNPRMTYRFVLAPETIGALTYIQGHLEALKENTVAGFVLSCVGDNRAYSHVESRLGGSLADKALKAALIGRENVLSYSFLYRGSDERQYCAPGVNLPVVGFCRSKYAEYPEYHTSADNFDVVTAEGLQGAFDVISTLIRAFETGLFPVSAVRGEPQLGKRNLYPERSVKGVYGPVKTRMNVLAYSDGQHSIFDIAQVIGAPLGDVIAEVQTLVEHGLLSLEGCRGEGNE
jgi:aminopeptidase-like protein